MNVYYLGFLFIFAVCLSECNATCNQQTVGSEVCIGFREYYQVKQWATCLTDAYIQQRSKGRHHCVDRTATYCYYQCMVETHGKDFGAVYSDCKCDPNERKPVSTPSPLPSWCKSPDGSNCNWYGQCLKQRYLCEENDDNDYGVEYAEKLCGLYTKSDAKFSSNARQWIDAVRKCLQVALVPLLRSWQTGSCNTLKSTAFASHSPCYLKPGENENSYCDLSFTDQMEVFWTIKSGFTSASKPSVKGVWDVLSNCLEKGRISTEEAQTTFSQFRLEFYVDAVLSDPSSSARVIDAIASQQKWRQKGVAWFAFANHAYSTTHSITTLIAERRRYEALDFSHIGTPSPVDINITLWELAEDVKNGTLTAMVQLSGRRYNVKVVRMTGCADWACTRTSFEVISPSACSRIAIFGGIQVYWAAIFVLLIHEAVTIYL